MTFSTDRSGVGEAVPDIRETGENSGIFTFELQLVTDEQACKNDDLGNVQFEAKGGPDPKIGVCSGDTLSIEYEDPFGEYSNNLSFSVAIRSWDPEFTIGDLSHILTAEQLPVYITDPDANRNLDMIDLIQDISVRSDSDAVGQVFSATET